MDGRRCMPKRGEDMSQEEVVLAVRQVRQETPEVLSFEMISGDGRPLPTYSPGAHITLRLPSGLSRSYSLLDDGLHHDCYRIATKREAQGGGGSIWMHDTLRVGQTVKSLPPANDFTLIEEAQHSVFFAGGIGITPILSMITRLTSLGRPWSLYYTGTSRARMAFVDKVEALTNLGCGKVNLFFTGEGDARCDLPSAISAAPDGTHFYCCGPNGLIDTFIEACSARAPAFCHYERFAGNSEAATEGGYELLLSSSGRRLPVPEGKTILDVLLDAGVDVPYACTQGVCGTCKIGVRSGVPDHRDECLSEEDREANNAVIACCSGALSPVLELDL